MKIIKEGTKFQKAMQITCKNCEAVLEIEKEDVQQRDEEKMSMRHETYTETVYFFKCPCCGSEEQRPYVVFEKIMWGKR